MSTSDRLLTSLLCIAVLSLTGFTAATPGLADDGPLASPAGAVLGDTVAVFVVWGSSNACGSGNAAISPVPEPGTAWMWHRNDPAYPAPRHLVDPAPCGGTGNYAGTGSAWTSFAVTYTALTGRTFFMSSASKGGSWVRVDTTPDGNGLLDWNPASSGELFDQGKATITNAMAKAHAQFPNDHVVFGGVLWWQGNDLGSTYPDGYFDGTWEDVRQAYTDLLHHYGQEVANNPSHAGYGGRFYFMNSPVKIDPDHSYSDASYKPIGDYAFDLEADVCGRFVFCSLSHASVEVWNYLLACNGNTVCERGWYDNDVHIGAHGLSVFGSATGEVAAAHSTTDPHTWEFAVELPQHVEWCSGSIPCNGDVRSFRIEVYDDAGAPVQAFAIDPTFGYPDWRADFDGSDPGADWRANWATLGTDFLTLEFYREETGGDVLLGRYVYMPTALTHSAGETDFFRPYAGAPRAGVHFEVTTDAVKAQTAAVAGRNRATAFFEDAFAEAFVLPYNHDTYAAVCSTSACPVEAADYFLARLPDDAARPDANTRRFTFGSEVNVALTQMAPALTWDVPNLVLAFPTGARLNVKGGTFAAEGVAFIADDPALGWGGITFSGSNGTLTGATVQHVRGPANVPGDAAVEVYDATVTLSGSFILDGALVHGLWASGSAARATLNGSLVQNMAINGAGAVAAEGAQVYVYDSTVRLNGYVGVGATGAGSTLYLYRSQVSENNAFGVVAEAGGEVFFTRPDDPVPSDGVTVSSNQGGGLFARAGGEVVAGIYNDRREECTAACQNVIENNWTGSSDFDARSIGKRSVVYAEYNFWGAGRSLNDLELVTGSNGKLHVEPLWDGVAPRLGAPAPVAADLPHDVQAIAAHFLNEGTPEGGRGSAVARLVDRAYEATVVGDSTAAGGLLLAAVILSGNDDDHGLSYGKSGRFLSHTVPPPLFDFLLTRMMPGTSTRPWAVAALLAGHEVQGQTSEAWAAAGTLTTEFSGTEHALPGLTMTARLAAELGNLEAAQAALAELQASWPDLLATESAAALVRRMETQAGARLGGPALAPEMARAEEQEGEAVASFRLHDARPNPFTGRTTVPFEVSRAAHVRVAVYDVLGREVAVLADAPFGPGQHVVAFDGRGLAAGLYLLEARMETETGTQRSYTQRVTLLR